MFQWLPTDGGCFQTCCTHYVSGYLLTVFRHTVYTRVTYSLQTGCIHQGYIQSSEDIQSSDRLYIPCQGLPTVFRQAVHTMSGVTYSLQTGCTYHVRVYLQSSDRLYTPCQGLPTDGNILQTGYTHQVRGYLLTVTVFRQAVHTMSGVTY